LYPKRSFEKASDFKKDNTYEAENYDDFKNSLNKVVWYMPIGAVMKIARPKSRVKPKLPLVVFHLRIKNLKQVNA